MSSVQFAPFLDYLSFEKRYSPHTILAYSSDLLQFSAYLSEHHDIFQPHEANYQLVRGWIAGLMDKKQSARSVNRKITTLRTYYGFLLRESVISVNPMLKIQGPKASK